MSGLVRVFFLFVTFLLCLAGLDIRSAHLGRGRLLFFVSLVGCNVCVVRRSLFTFSLCVNSRQRSVIMARRGYLLQCFMF